MHKLVGTSTVAGKTLYRIYDTERGWRHYSTHTQVPDDKHLMNFVVVGHNRKEKDKLDLMVLDNYGNEFLPGMFEEAIFGHPTEGNSGDYTLAVNRDTGQIYQAAFGTEKGGLILCVSSRCMPVVPKTLLPRLECLLHKKRPFCLTMPDHFLFQYIDGWASKGDLEAHLVVSFDLDGPDDNSRREYLEVQRGGIGESSIWRLVSEWKDG